MAPTAEVADTADRGHKNKAVMSKSIAMIETYSVNSADKPLISKAKSATFPKWNGTEQQRLIPIATTNDSDCFQRRRRYRNMEAGKVAEE